jgi:hypothetical protein
MMLPLSSQTLMDISLANHLALAVCRKDQGSVHLLYDLIRTVYLTYYLQRGGFGDAPLDLYRSGETALKEAAVRADRDGVWGVGEEATVILGEILSLHDRQLASAAMWNIVEARERLIQFIQSHGQSPIPTPANIDSYVQRSAEGC